MAQQHVVIVGGGFGGLATAQALAKRRDVRVTLIDRRNHHLFQPLLYQVATAALSPSDIAEPIRSILSRQTNVTVRLGEVTEVDLQAKRVCVSSVRGDQAQSEWLDYDRIVLALGVTHSYFGNNNWAPHAPGLKTIGDALEIRRRLLLAFEQAEWAASEEERRRRMTFVVVGGGPTGVELAGAIAEIAIRTLRKDFRQIDTAEARVVLVEAGSTILSPYPEHLRDKAVAQLRKLGVEVRLGVPVSAVDAEGVDLGEERIEAGTVLWAAGVQAPALTRQLGVETDRAGRVRVGSDCSIPGHPDAFVIGDLAAFEDPEVGMLPGVAPVAQQQGAYVAAQLAVAPEKRPPFRYFDKGSMATIGRSKAIMKSGPLEWSGLFAWLAWVFVHLMVLVTYRNRMLVFLKWAWAWVTFERSSRLIWQTEDHAVPVEVAEDEVA